ncbi:hypothetical protein [Rhodohalobacter sp.]|uniref:hypothetical protein n=1 Tax=Rhodohalobacter sp. TaxID=1974210 RepID=UPI002ACDCDF8|nr:hypothetical protein [Rhodohalobacter sp.]MDZ7757187.1 hypothetical protein [Rhodohalobacter sp.]
MDNRKIPSALFGFMVAYRLSKNRGWDTEVTVNQDGDLMMRALVDGVELRITKKGAAYYRRMPDDTLSSSQSAGRFSRKGRESQIHVLQKISKKLVEKNKLDAYREPITDALNEIRTLCQDRYPELAVKCTDLINKYGDPRYVRFVRNSFGAFIRSMQRLSNIAAHNLTRSGLDNVRKFVSHPKNRFSSQNSSETKLHQNNEKEQEEITYGLTAYQ